MKELNRVLCFKDLEKQKGIVLFGLLIVLKPHEYSLSIMIHAKILTIILLNSFRFMRF